MKNLLVILVISFLSQSTFAQSEINSIEQKNDSTFKIDSTGTVTSEVYKVFYPERPKMDKPKKQPIYHNLKVIGGIIYAASGTTDFSNIEKPFTFGQNLMPNVCFITNNFYHNVVYGLANNTVKIVNGFPFGEKGLDVYVIPGINLNSGVVSMSSGIEKKVEAGGVNFFMFAELGKDLKSGSKLCLSIGFHVNIQGVISQHKGREILPLVKY